MRAFMRSVLAGFVVSLLMGVCVVVSPAVGAVPAPGFTIDSFASPTSFSAADNTRCLKSLKIGNGVCDAYEVTVTNAGSVATDGSPITITDKLPGPGLTVQSLELISSTFGINFGGAFCNVASVNCTFPPFPVPLPPESTLKMIVNVTVDEPETPGPLGNEVSVSGGGGATVSAVESNRIGSTPPSFGTSAFDFFIDGSNGMRDTQAGDHPYELTTTIALNNMFREPPDISGGLGRVSVQDPRDIVVDLPLGFVGSTLSAPQCTMAQLSGVGCPPDTVVGHLVTEPAAQDSIDSPVWNIVPEHGVPAEFGYRDALKASHTLYVHVVPTSKGYVLETTSPDISEISLSRIVVTFYGNPAERDESSKAQVPFFTNPTGCTAGPLVSSIHMDSWTKPGRFHSDGTPDLNDPAWVSNESVSPPVTGCNGLQFTPELAAQPTTTLADTPSGLDFELKVPQTENASVPATSEMRTATVTLPEGMTVDPSAGDGLDACSVAQIGWLGGTPKNFNQAPVACPEASKIGSLELTTPLIPGTLTGALYIARQNENPFGSVVAAYVVVDDPVTGVLIKLAGRFLPDPNTGRITALFEENPQLPFSDLKLHFFGGPRAELMTPEGCGQFTTSSDLEPWSAPDSGADPTPTDTYLVQAGCVDGFNPTFAAGSTNLQAGAYTPFVASFTRKDTDQDMAGLSVSLPPGLLANLTGVPLCPDTNAASGTCPAASQVGTVLAGAGPGPNPLFVTGKAFLTGRYKGGPYGLSVVVPAIAGPFNFGTVVVRQSLQIDPNDAHVTDISDPFPTILNATGTDGNTIGIPIHLKRVDVRIDRPAFTFNPTNCAKLQIGGSMSSTGGLNSTLAVPFQVTNCATFAFKPVFKVSTSGKTSRATGASLTVKLSYPKAAFGSQANIKSVKVDLPKQLPSQLKTLQQACPDSTFTKNPALCGPGSRVGTATASTPILATTLTGPAYFVSHGGAKFPELVIVLSGGGITVDLHGETFISKTGITSSTFHQIPDVPIGTFTLNLPQGKNPALAAPAGKLCQTTLKMPTAFTAQNGAVIKQSTPIAVTGCGKEKKGKKHRGTGKSKRRP